MAPSSNPDKTSLTWNAIPVLSLEEEKELIEDRSRNGPPLVVFHAASIVDRRQTARLSQILSTNRPLPDSLRHLKRVRSCSNRLDILLCPANDHEWTHIAKGDDNQDFSKETSRLNGAAVSESRIVTQSADFVRAPLLAEIFKDNMTDLKGLGDPFLVSVPSKAPKSRKDQQSWATYWPSTFHSKQKNVDPEKCHIGDIMSEREKARIGSYMHEAIQAARCSQNAGYCGAGAAVVDPRKELVLAVAGDQTRQTSNPLLHACMVAIDLVAKRQGGGAYLRVTGEDIDRCDVGGEPLFGKSDPVVLCQTSSEIQHHPGTGDKRKRTEECNQMEEHAPYLCSGYEVYVTREPCIMCSMALLHSRVSCVYYGRGSPGGALGTSYRLHCSNDLNHRFLVYRGVLEDECRGAAN